MANYGFNPITGKIDRIGSGSAPPGTYIQTINGVAPDVGGDYVIESGDGSVIITPLADGVDLSVAPSGVDLHTARFIVSAGGLSDGANYTSIASAIADAVTAGGSQTVFIQPGNYTEDLTLAENVNLVAYPADASTPNAIITGKLTATFTGSCSISGLFLSTAGTGDYGVEITGSNATNINFIGCNFNTVANDNFFHCTNASGSMQFFSCRGACGGSNTFFIFTGGNVSAKNSVFGSANSTVPSTFADSNFNAEYCYFSVPIETSGTGSFAAEFCDFLEVNTTAITHNGSGNSYLYFTRIETGTASAISIGASAILPVLNCAIYSLNASTITGAGTVRYGEIDFYGIGATSVIDTVTQEALTSQMGQLQLKNPLGTAHGGTGIIAAGALGNVLTSDGTDWISSPPAGGGTPVAFDVYLNANTGAVTGDGTLYPVIYDTVNFDTASGYNTGTGLYTFPANGVYQIIVKHFVYVASGTSSSTLFLSNTTGTLNDRLTDVDPNALGLTTNQEFITYSTFLFNATAGDTMGIAVGLYFGTLNIGLSGTFLGCHFSGSKVA